MKIPIEGSDYCVRIVDFPDATVGGTVVEDYDGFCSIYINARRSCEEQRKSLRHEIAHIVNNDFHNGKNIAKIEGRDSE